MCIHERRKSVSCNAHIFGWECVLRRYKQIQCQQQHTSAPDFLFVALYTIPNDPSPILSPIIYRSLMLFFLLLLRLRLDDGDWGGDGTIGG